MDPNMLESFKSFMMSNSQTPPNFSSPPNFQQNLYSSPNPVLPSQPISYNSPTTFPPYSSQSPQLRPTRPSRGRGRSSRAILQQNIPVHSLGNDNDEEDEDDVEEEEDEFDDQLECGATVVPGMPPSNPRKWSILEDMALCSGYIQAGGDVQKGADQKGKHLWASIHRLYDDARRENPTNIAERQIRGLKGRWSRINALVAKFAGVYAEAARMKRSGASHDDVLTDARSIWQGTQNAKGQVGPKFSLEHCWDMLRKFPKWDGLPFVEDESSIGGGSSKRTTPESASDEGDFMRKRRGKGKGKADSSHSQFRQDMTENIKAFWVERENETEKREDERHQTLMQRMDVSDTKADVRHREKMRLKYYFKLLDKPDRTEIEEERLAKLDAEFGSGK